jgi:hypothetical protein
VQWTPHRFTRRIYHIPPHDVVACVTAHRNPPEVHMAGVGGGCGVFSAGRGEGPGEPRVSPQPPATAATVSDRSAP